VGWGGVLRELSGPIKTTDVSASYEEMVRKLGQIRTCTVLPALNTHEEATQIS